MHSSLLVGAALFVCGAMAAARISVDDYQGLCQRYPSLAICQLSHQLNDELQNALSDQHLEPELVGARDSSIPAQESHNPQQQAAEQQQVAKRKSAFVRFGKRSGDAAPDAEFAMNDSELRYPWNALLNVRPARKSSYVRFG